MIAALLATRPEAEFVAAAHVIPFRYAEVSRIAHKAELRFPEALPVYGDWTGWMPEV